MVNGGFENVMACPEDISGQYFDLLEHTGNWMAPSFNTSDFFHECAIPALPFGGASPTENVWGGQQPKNGKGMAGFGISCGDSAGADYIQSALFHAVEPYQEYLLELWVSSGDSRNIVESGVVCRIDALEVLFTEEAFFWPDGSYIEGFTPQVQLRSNASFLSDSLNWIQLVDTVVLDFPAKHMTIGRFTPTLLGQNCECFVADISAGAVYYYIDEVSLYPLEQVIVPNVFTPNGDGKNNRFQLQGYCGSFSIYNRWGTLIETVSNENGWDGTISGNDAPEGTYYFITDDLNLKRAFQLLR